MSEKIFILAAEASGDLQGAFLMLEIKKHRKDAIFAGVGGRKLREEGMDIWYDPSIFGCIGPWNALPKIPSFLKFINNVKKRILEWQPDLLILIDSPAINMRIGKFAKKHNLKVAYYFPPSAWYSNVERVLSISQAADYIIPVFKFNVKTYRRAGLKHYFFGHPLIDIVSSKIRNNTNTPSLPAGKIYIAILPGSRLQEINSLMPVFTGLMNTLNEKKGHFHFLIPIALPDLKEIVKKHLSKIPEYLYTLIEGGAYQALQKADLAVMASGSATLEAAVIGVPMIVVYKLAWPDWILGKLFVKVPFFALPNLILQKKAVPELLQKEVNPSRLYDEVMKIIDSSEVREAMISDLKDVKNSLGEEGVIPKVASLINDILK